MIIMVKSAFSTEKTTTFFQGIILFPDFSKHSKFPGCATTLSLVEENLFPFSRFPFSKLSSACFATFH